MFVDKPLTRRFGRDMLALDTKKVREPTDLEMAQYRDFWEAERARLLPQIDRKKREWLAKQSKQLEKHMPNVSPEQRRAILEQRWLGHLVGSDAINLDGQMVTIRKILLNPDKYDGKTGPDPIEPGYRNGAQTCKVYMNRSKGRPMIYSQAHGGIKYWLWHDAQSVITYLKSMDLPDARASLKTILHATRVAESTEIETLLLDLAKIIGSTKKELSRNYRELLMKNMRAVSPIAEHLGQVGPIGSTRINDLADCAAKKLILDETCITSDDSDVWRFNGKHFERVSETSLGSDLRKKLIEQNWDSKSGLIRTTKDAITALKYQTYSPKPINAREPKKILNFQNGELHFSPDGSFDLRDHDPSSQLTSVLSIDYDENAEAPVFRRTLEELFFPPAHDRMKPRSNSAQEAYERSYRVNASIMADHVEELLAYFLIPDRWIPAWFLWIGGGHNGKTFLTKLLSLLLDDDAIESDRIQAFSSDKFGMERLIGKTMIIDDDLITGTKIPDGFVKKVSETKLVSANRKNKTSVTFINRCAVLLLTNNYPVFSDVSRGMRRRIYSLDFPRRFYSRTEIEAMSDGPLKEHAEHDLADTQRINQIEGELPGVVNRLVRAYQRLMKREGFLLPKDVKNSNDKLLRESNPLPMFIDTQCIHEAKYRFKTSEFARELRGWLQREHNNWDPQNRQIRKMMDHLGWNVVKNDGIDHYVGIKLKRNISETDTLTDVDDDSDDDDWDDEVDEDEDDDCGN